MPAPSASRDSPRPPRVVPWVVFGTTVGLVAAAVIALAALGQGDDGEITTTWTTVVGVTTVLFGAVVGLAVGQFIRMSGIVRAWRPTLPTVLDAPAPSTNGHGKARGKDRGTSDNGALFAVLAAVGAVLAGPVVIPLLPAPIVLGVGALALDRRAWVRVVATVGLFVAAVSLVGFLVEATRSAGARDPVFLAAIVLIGVAGFVTARGVRPAG